MFTGLIEELGTVTTLDDTGAGVDLVIRATTVLEDAALGDSIAVQGVCLTVADLGPGQVTFGLAPETLRLTSLGALREGDPVNLERALLPTTRMGGHYVQGHIDGTGQLQSIREDGDALWVTIEAPTELLTYIVKKAYVAIDGTSLTVTDVTDTTFSVMLVRHTQPRITLPTKKPGDPVNLEVDIMAKFAEKIIRGADAMTGFVSVEKAAEALAEGRMVIIADDEGRENEGDLVIGAEFADAAAINFMAIHGRGLVCCALEATIIERLALKPMVPAEHNRSGFGTAFTVSVEAREGVTTGISAADRARTVEVLINPESAPSDLVAPGHMFPLRAQPGGVLTRGGQTEASVDLAKLAGLRPGAVICEIMNDDGTMARRPELEEFSARHGIPITTTEALRQYLLARGSLAAE